MPKWRESKVGVSVSAVGLAGSRDNCSGAKDGLSTCTDGLVNVRASHNLGGELWQAMLPSALRSRRQCKITRCPLAVPVVLTNRYIVRSIPACEGAVLRDLEDILRVDGHLLRIHVFEERLTAYPTA